MPMYAADEVPIRKDPVSSNDAQLQTVEAFCQSIEPAGAPGVTGMSASSTSDTSGSTKVAVVPQRNLITRALQSEDCIETFIKNRPIVLYPLMQDTVSMVPQNVVDLLGTMDKSEYPLGMLEQCLGGAIVLQVSDGDPDFYPIPRKDYEMYDLVPLSDVEKYNPGLTDDLVAMLKLESLSSMPLLQAGLKVKDVHMIKLSKLGFDIAEEARLEAPWGGSQTKPPRQDAYLALAYSGDGGEIKEVYMVNSDALGLPIAYKPADKSLGSKPGRGTSAA